MQWGYLAGVWAAVKLGMPAGMTALIVGISGYAKIALPGKVIAPVTAATDANPPR